MPSVVSRTFGVRGIQRIGRLPIATLQTYKAGDFLVLNALGQLTQATTAGTNVGAVSATNLIVGRAIEDAQPSVNDISIIPTTKLYGEFIVAEPGTQFELPIYHATASSAYPSPALLSVGYELGNITFPSAAGGTTCYAVDIGHTSNIKVIVVDFVPDEYAGWPDVGQSPAPTTGTFSQYARAWVEFIGVTTALSGARPVTRS